MPRILLLLFLAATSLSAQSTQQDIEARLLNKPLYLRGTWLDDKLKFDSAGALRGSSRPTSFTLAGIEVLKVNLRSDRLELDGRRVGLAFKDRIPSRIILKLGNPKDTHDEKIHIEIEAPPSGDYNDALNAVFTTDLASFVPALPVWWQRFAPYLQPDPPSTPAPLSKGDRSKRSDVTPPKVLFAPEPQFNNYARSLKYAGNVLVYLQVDKEGKPVKIAILRPMGLGMDEQAVAAVQKYRFQPATENGEPIIVEMNVEVNFQIF